MEPYVVHDGDHLLQLAYKMGFDADTVWNDPKNADLKKLRGDPNILRGGDLLYVPKRPRQWLPVKVGGVNAFVAHPAVVEMSLAFTQSGKALAGADCVVHGIPLPNQFTTDGDGKLKLSVPVTVHLITVEFPSIPLIVSFHVGALDPIAERTGIAQRLRNLGYGTSRGPLDPSDDDAVTDAISRFQTAQGLAATGTLDDDTQKALESAHGC